jgi:hypothetical protein
MREGYETNYQSNLKTIESRNQAAG